MTDIRLGLLGNPNVGKSTLFNLITGADQHVGNWPGKTVERRSGGTSHSGEDIELIDLPGVYSLASATPEEVVTEEVVLTGQVDVVAVVLDASNLERNLYLASQVAETGIPRVLVLNMADLAAAEGFQIDDAVLSEVLGGPVVRTVARDGEGVDLLLSEAVRVARLARPRSETGGAR